MKTIFALTIAIATTAIYNGLIPNILNDNRPDFKVVAAKAVR